MQHFDQPYHVANMRERILQDQIEIVDAQLAQAVKLLGDFKRMMGYK